MCVSKLRIIWVMRWAGDGLPVAELVHPLWPTFGLAARVDEVPPVVAVHVRYFAPAHLHFRCGHQRPEPLQQLWVLDHGRSRRGGLDTTDREALHTHIYACIHARLYKGTAL